MSTIFFHSPYLLTAVFRDGAFYTGDHHNHLLPKFEVYADTEEGIVSSTVQDLEITLRREFDRESSKPHNDRKADLVNSMGRLSFFSPQAIQEAQARFII